MNNWEKVLKEPRGISGGPPKDRKKKPRYGTTTPKGSYQDKINELLKDYADGKITMEQYLKEKAKLETQFPDMKKSLSLDFLWREEWLLMKAPTMVLDGMEDRPKKYMSNLNKIEKALKRHLDMDKEVIGEALKLLKELKEMK